MTTVSAAQLPSLYEGLGIDLNGLGVVMLSLEPGQSLVDEKLGLSADDLYTSKHPNRKYLTGEPIVHASHTTLLYGLLPGINAADVQDVMHGWEPPLAVLIDSYELFPAQLPESDPDYDQYAVLVGRIQLLNSPEVLEAHQRLSLLPHIDTYPEYKPHVTLAYVKKEAAPQWLWIAEARDIMLSVDTSKDARGLLGVTADEKAARASQTEQR